MSLASRLRHPIETFRTAPFGFSIGAFIVGADATIACMIEASNHSTSPRNALILAGCIALSASGVITAGKAVSNQFELEERLDASIEKNGFNERVFATTTDEWCNRQTARVVCERSGVLDEYVELCNSLDDTAKLTYLPHF